MEKSTKKIILGIETSCDETALSLVEADGGAENSRFKVIGTSLFSQVKIHEQYGGVFPMLAKREHSKNLVPLLKKLLEESDSLKEINSELDTETKKNLESTLAREPELLEAMLDFLPKTEKPAIDLIAVTCGPGLEPALWVGINFARALSLLWNIPIIPTNHMEGHIVSAVLENQGKIHFPAIALLISGGHTEFVLAKNWRDYKLMGKTRDDAVGEAFDKVARLLSLPYPGGPHISEYANRARAAGRKSDIKLPRPMLDSDNFDFSFSGLKTAVLYTVKKIPELTQEIKEDIAKEFEDAVTEVLTTKARKIIETFEVRSLILGGGVIANTHIREAFSKLAAEYPETKLFIPPFDLATDNAVMIAMAGYIESFTEKSLRHGLEEIKAQGNLSF